MSLTVQCRQRNTMLSGGGCCSKVLGEKMLSVTGGIDEQLLLGSEDDQIPVLHFEPAQT